MSEHNALLDAYLAGPGLLRKAVAGLSADQLTARPVPGKWSVLEVVCHLADFEPVYTDRIRRTIALERPSLLVADENEFVKYLCYHQRDLEQELAMIEAIRTATAQLLRHIPSEAWTRVGVHSIKGDMTVVDLLKSSTGHIPSHLVFIDEKRKAMGV